MAKDMHRLTTVTGTGSGGRISKQDIEAVISGGASALQLMKDSACRPARTAPVAPAPVAGGAGPAGNGTQYIPSLQLGVPRERLYFGTTKWNRSRRCG